MQARDQPLLSINAGTHTLDDASAAAQREKTARQKANELLNRSRYDSGSAQATDFLSLLASRSNQIPMLLTPCIGEGVSALPGPESTPPGTAETPDPLALRLGTG